MRYFIIKQDQNLPHSIKLRDFNMAGAHKILYKEEADQLNDMSMLYVLGNADYIYPDFIENPVYLISERIQKVFDMYQDDLVFKKVILTNKEERTQQLYYNLLTDHVEALSEKTQFYPDGRAKELILDSNKIRQHKIFQLEQSLSNYLIVSLDVVESFLRREVIGIQFRELEVV